MRDFQIDTMKFGRSGQPGRFFFSRRAHLLTTRRWRAVVSLPLVGTVRSPGVVRLLRSAQTMLHFCGIAVIVHTVGVLLSAEIVRNFL